MRKMGKRQQQVLDWIIEQGGEVAKPEIGRALDLNPNVVKVAVNGLIHRRIVETRIDPDDPFRTLVRTVDQPKPRQAGPPVGQGDIEQRLHALEEIVNRIVLAPPEGTLAGDLTDLRRMMLLTYGFPLDSPLIERLDRLLLEYCGIRVHPSGEVAGDVLRAKIGES